jgi:BMFP domain-containing protein YqiC
MACTEWLSPDIFFLLLLLLQKPQTLVEAVDKLVALRLEDVQQTLAAGYATKAAALVARVGQLEQQQQQTAQQQTSHPHK